MPDRSPVLRAAGLAVAAAFAAGAAAAQSPSAGAAPDDAGRLVAERLCAGCHSVAPGTASPLAQAPPLTLIGRRYPVESIAEALAEGIVTGHGPVRMPEFRLEPPDIEALIAYLETVQEP
jgi:mono/diheme cytochrome c family protein